MLYKLAKVERKLCLKRSFGKLRWAWRRVFFKSLEVGNGINKHMLIVGESGSGKSNAAKNIVKMLSEKGASFALFDPHDEYIDLAGAIGAKVYDASYIGTNIFELGGMSIKEKSSELTELFRRIFKLGEVQSNILYRLISYTYSIYAEEGKTPTIGSIIYSAKVFKRHADKKELSILDALEKRLALANEFATKTIDAEVLMHSKSIFALSSLHTSEAQALYIEGFLRKIYTSMLASEKNSYNFYIVIDEAEKLGESKILARLANEGRKYGIGIMAIAQHAKRVEKSLRGNASLVLAFYQREPEELNYVANMIAGGNELERFVEVKKMLRNLKQGQAVAMQQSEPMLIRFSIFKGKEDPSYYIFKLAKEPIKEEELLEKMKEKGFAEEEVMLSLNELTKSKMLGLYELKSSIYRGRYYMKSSRNGSEHDIVVNIMGMFLKKKGIGNKIYNTSYGPDIIARINGVKVAIEYETGKKELSSTEEMLSKRRDSFKRVILVANDSAKERYKGIKIDGVEVLSLSEFLS
ncbi:MAG: ATP-binding protein [Candidatus Micrarchaeia archaeon]|jgi:energy-coupling factor transporter ATP-binding protein EcfA2